MSKSVGKKGTATTVKNMSKKHTEAEVITSNASTGRVLLAGDLHGEANRGFSVLAAAAREGCSMAIILGDFGFWEHTYDGEKYLKSLQKSALRLGVNLAFLDGNHDNHPLLWERYCGVNAKRNNFGFFEVRPNIHYIPRGHRWHFGTTSFVALGGAYSVDKEWRLQTEQGLTTNVYGRRIKGKGPNTLWWDTEEIRPQDLAQAVSGGKVDVALTHDCPTGGPTPTRKNYPETLPNRDRVRALVDAVKPEKLFHGHFHIRQRTNLVLEDGHTTEIVGLGDNRTPLEEQIIVLEY